MKFLHILGVLGLIPLFFNSCVQTNQEFYVNQNGSGKVRVEATMTSGGQFNFQQRDKEESKNTYKDTVKMVEKVRKILEKAEGVKAWKDIEYSLDEEGRIVFKGTAYFDDIKSFKLGEIPYIPVAEFSKKSARWLINEAEMKKGKKMEIKDDKEKQEDLTEEEVEKRVEKIQNDYRQFSAMMGMAMRMFEYEATFHFPYKIKSTINMEEVGERAVKGELEGERILEGYDKLMDNEETLRELVKEKGVKEFNFENPHIMKAAYPDESFMKVEFKTGLFSGKPKDPFNYKEEIRQLDTASPKIPMPEKAGSN